jgi:hypothetical protein
MSLATLVMRGVPVNVLTAAATGETGVGKSLVFTLATNPASNGSVKFQRKATGALTALVCDLESSIDGGVTYHIEQLGLDFNTAPVIVLGLIQGSIYRLNVTSVTVVTSVDIIAVLG